MVATASRRVGPLTVAGVTSARVMVPPTGLAALGADSRVFLVDITPTLARQDLGAAQIADADQAKIVDGSPFWFMEDLGLGNF